MNKENLKKQITEIVSIKKQAIEVRQQLAKALDEIYGNTQFNNEYKQKVADELRDNFEKEFKTVQQTLKQKITALNEYTQEEVNLDDPTFNQAVKAIGLGMSKEQLNTYFDKFKGNDNALKLLRNQCKIHNMPTAYIDSLLFSHIPNLIDAFDKERTSEDYFNRLADTATNGSNPMFLYSINQCCDKFGIDREVTKDLENNILNTTASTDTLSNTNHLHGIL